MEYKNYMGSVEYSDEDNILYGSITGIKDSVSYHGRSIDEIKAAFADAVDHYLDMCEAEGLQPDIPFNGTLGVSLSPNVYKQLVSFSASKNQTVNRSVEDAIKQHVAV
jgi:predicted HicB family RNase H-like nuclease